MSFEPIDSTTATSTWDASPYVDPGARTLTLSESALIVAMLDMTPNGDSLRDQLVDARVEFMKDGGMGSLRFAGLGSRKMGRQAIAVRAADEDGVPLEISLNLDQNGDLFELDVWRVDFKPLLRLPKPGDLKLV